MVRKFLLLGKRIYIVFKNYIGIQLRFYQKVTINIPLLHEESEIENPIISFSPSIYMFYNERGKKDIE